VCIIVVLVGYGLIWPRGTLTHGRPLDWRATLLFGPLWGISEGLLFVSIWLMTGWLSDVLWVRWLLAFLSIAAFIGIWHAAYWDVHVAPDHNIAAWNGRKVVFAHVPNLAVTLAHLALFDQPWLMVLCQAIALTLSTHFMRFPWFRA
jgi:hypothetical protein